MPKTIRIFTLLSLAIFFLGCQQHKTPKTYFDSNWVKDSIGCLNLRTKELATKLINSNNLLHDTKTKFLDIFKSPNKIETIRGIEILTYFMGNFCEAGKPIENTDKCYAKFYFKNNRLSDTSFSCE